MRHIITASGEIVYDYQGQLHITKSIKKIELIEQLDELIQKTYYKYTINGINYKTLMSRVNVITKQLSNDVDGLMDYLEVYQAYMHKVATLQSEVNSL